MNPFLTNEARRRGVNSLLLILLLLVIIFLFIISFALGRYPTAPRDLLTMIGSRLFNYSHGLPDVLETVVFNVRLPRIIAAIIVGAALSAAGAAYQGLFRNPLISPDIMGASAGAGLGAAVAIYLSLGPLGVQVYAFIFGLSAVMITYGISTRMRSDPTLSLILSGIMMGSVFSALICLIKYVADPFEKLPSITFWMMGSLSGINPPELAVTALPIIAGTAVLLLLRWRLNALTFGDEEAMTMGLNVTWLRMVIIVCATLVTSAAVSITGLIGWVGLVIPHLARMLVGPDYKVLLPASVLMGAIYLLLVDDIARLASSLEIPIGILTSLLGVPFFLYLFSQRKEI